MEEEEYEEELREKIKNLLIAVRAILQVLQELMVNMYNNQVQHPLSRRPKTSIGYDYVHRILNEEPTKHCCRIQDLFVLKRCLQHFYLRSVKILDIV